MNEEGQPQEGQPQQGQPQQQTQPQPQQQPQYQQGQVQRHEHPQHQRRQDQDTFEGLAKNSTLTTVVIVGLIILMVGAIVINAANFSDDGGTIEDVTTVGNILQDIGVFLVAGFMLIASIYRDEWSKWMRIGTLTFGLLLILVAWFDFLAPLIHTW